jgi:hypothetical protein
VFSLACALALIPLAVPSLAFAVPEGGASPDTPGTYAEVSPKELRPGATIQFAISGYPAGEVLNIKIDDGSGYSNQAQAGTGVIHTQIIGASGSTSGSLQLPGDISEGWHWLRFLASEVVEGKGVLGYTNGAGNASNTSHPTAFYIAGESLGGASAQESVVGTVHPGTNATQGGAGNGSGGGANSGSTTTGLDDGNAGANGVDTGTDTGSTTMSEEEAAAAANAALLSGETRGSTTGTTTGRVVAENLSPASVGAASVFDILPLPGLIILGIVVILGIAAMMFVALRRPRPAIVSGIDAVDRVGDGVTFGGGFTVPTPLAMAPTATPSGTDTSPDKDEVIDIAEPTDAGKGGAVDVGATIATSASATDDLPSRA